MSRIARHAALVAGVVTAGVLAWTRPLQRAMQPPFPTAPVLVAAKDLPEGTFIDQSSVAVARWPVGTLPAGAFTSPRLVLGLVTRDAVFRGEAIRLGRLVPRGASRSGGVKLTPGKRAFSFRVTDVSATAGLVKPNSRVDLLLVVDAGGLGKKVANVFMENLRVLAIGVVAERRADGRVVSAAVCTVEVTPAERERLTAATRQGEIRIVLRARDDVAPDVAISSPRE